MDRGIICAWSDGDASEGDVSLAYPAALGLDPETIAGICDQVQENPEDLGIVAGNNWILCGGFTPDEFEDPGYYLLSRITPYAAQVFAEKVIEAIAEYWASDEAFEAAHGKEKGGD